MSEPRPAQSPPLLPLHQQRVLDELSWLKGSVAPGCLGASWTPARERAQFLDKLAQARPEVLLASGPGEVNLIHEYVPAVLRPFARLPRAKTIEQATQLVAYNLDWYMAPPQRLIRRQWVYSLMKWIILPTGFTASLSLFFLGLIPAETSAYIMTGCIVFGLLPLGASSNNRTFWVHMLDQHLRKVYNAVEAASDA